MPNREKIQNEINIQKSSGQDIVRRKYLKKLADYTRVDTIIYFSSYNIMRPMNIPTPALTVSEDDIQGFMASLHGLTGEKLDLVLHSPGGSLEAADQIVQYLRSKYGHIRVIVPQNAMSAATMIACAADEIVMGKHSAIGPIDPQMSIPGPNGIMMSIPAHTILQDFKQAKDEIMTNPVLANLWVPKLQMVPPGYLNLCDQTIKLSKIKVELWLKTYMFQGQDDQKATEIADWLGNFEEHKTHGRPINYDLAAEKGLKVKRLEDDQQLQERVLSVYHATMVTFQTTQCLKIIENQNGKGYYVVAQLVIAPAMPPTQ
jgi:hypothetical protein